jgi:molybdate transport system ATP-binding protein
MLDVVLTHTVGTLTLDVRHTFGPGLTALVGASGAGKTTLLRLIAGVARPDRGVIRLDDHVLVDTDRGAWCPPHRRRVGYVAQSPHLFPHLSVRHNLRYASWCAQGATGGATWDEVIALLDLHHLLARSPHTLSGGEQQRVALGRALLAAPRLLLLDEPLNAIDVDRRHEILPYLDQLRSAGGLPMLYVTHTMAEVEQRADAVLRLSDGRLAVLGSTPGHLNTSHV